MSWQLQQAKNQLSSLVDQVVAGHEQVITRYGKPVCVVVPYERWQEQRLRKEPSLYDAVRGAAEFGGLPEIEPREVEEDREQSCSRD